MNFLVIQETDWIRRGPHQQHHLFERLSKIGHRVTVLDFEINYTPWPYSPLVAPRLIYERITRTDDEANVCVIRPATIRLPGLARIVSMVTFFIEIMRITKTIRPDVIVNYAISTGLCALAIAKIKNIPFVLHVIDALHTLVPYRWLRPFAYWMETILLRNSNATIYINQKLKEYGLQHGANPDYAHMVGTGVDLDLFESRNNKDINDIRAKWGIASSDVLLIFVGWLYEFSGIDTIMRILPSMPQSLKIMVVGTGEMEDNLVALSEKLRLQNRVIFTGHQPYKNIPTLISAADICLLYSTLNPTTRDILPIKVYEYLACSRPVLASKLPGLIQEVPSGNGIIYTESDYLVQTLKDMMEQNNRLKEGAKARRFVEKHCNWSIITISFEKLLVQITNLKQ
ncbi:MAG: hypothetical protein CL606_07375 [Anaerolineaceae bacterium]|nr:hypothetical protein [Anaerolineaceae bacterium]